jgi:hypothetical protein
MEFFQLILFSFDINMLADLGNWTMPQQHQVVYLGEARLANKDITLTAISHNLTINALFTTTTSCVQLKLVWNLKYAGYKRLTTNNVRIIENIIISIVETLLMPLNSKYIKYITYIIIVGAINSPLAAESNIHGISRADKLTDNNKLYSTPIDTKTDFSQTPNTAQINNLTPHKRTLWEKTKGEPSHDAVLLDMLVWHFRKSSRKTDRWNSQLIGVLYKGMYATTFLNSFDDRAFGFGISRDYYQKHLSKNTEMDLGYQLGIVTGYDERMTPFAKYTPVLPVIIPSINFRYRLANIGLAWILDVATLSASISF